MLWFLGNENVGRREIFRGFIYPLSGAMTQQMSLSRSFMNGTGVWYGIWNTMIRVFTGESLVDMGG